jgi:UDP-3-O-[3-hydroxymyristoyl] N-acetylglucosamine deacetylase/UDP-3-O-[3-hydroxymyristoyl] N-acetylglucosamine deacetylase/3-hydroxyacyl-[acyl-carrier-protein] dehydratase
LVIGADGPIDNSLRAGDECARHKILDCLGDFALLGCDIQGHFCAYRSGHHLNRELVRKLLGGAEQETNANHRMAA